MTGGLVAAPIRGAAQPAARTYRIGFLNSLPAGASDVGRVQEPFVQRLRELGYVEGENLVIERRHAPEGQPDRLQELAADLVRLKVDAIVAGGSLTPHAAKSATTTVPVIFTNHGDPLGSGLVSSLARPGGNITGVSLLAPDLVGKQLELLKNAVPRVVRVAVLWNPTSRTHPRNLDEAEAPGRTLGLRLERVSARGLDDYDRAFAAMTRARAQALLVLGDPIFWYQRSRIVELARTSRLPGMFAQREFVEAGGLMSYGADLRDSLRRAAAYVDRILKGTKPGDLPIEQPTKFDLVINARTANALRLTIPSSLLARADEIVEK